MFANIIMATRFPVSYSAQAAMYANATASQSAGTYYLQGGPSDTAEVIDGNLRVTGNLQVDGNEVVGGALSATSVAATAAVTAASVAASGAVTAATATVTGIINSGGLVTAGTVGCGAANVTAALTAATVTATGGMTTSIVRSAGGLVSGTFTGVIPVGTTVPVLNVNAPCIVRMFFNANPKAGEGSPRSTFHEIIVSGSLDGGGNLFLGAATAGGNYQNAASITAVNGAGGTPTAYGTACVISVSSFTGGGASQSFAGSFSALPIPDNLAAYVGAPTVINYSTVVA